MSATTEAERFYVATTEGFLSAAAKGGGQPWLTAHVIDRLHCRRVVAHYRSERQRYHRSTSEGRRAKAVHLAELEAARLNRIYTHSEREPAQRQ